jgi:hypothetical protein
LQQVGLTTIKFYAEVMNWRFLSHLQRQARQIQNILTVNGDFIPFFLFDFP